MYPFPSLARCEAIVLPGRSPRSYALPASAEEMTLEAERLEVAAEHLRDKLMRLVLAKG